LWAGVWAGVGGGVFFFVGQGADWGKWQQQEEKRWWVGWWGVKKRGTWVGQLFGWCNGVLLQSTEYRKYKTPERYRCREEI